MKKWRKENDDRNEGMWNYKALFGAGGRQTDRQTDMFLFGVLYKESTLTTIPNS